MVLKRSGQSDKGKGLYYLPLLMIALLSGDVELLGLSSYLILKIVGNVEELTSQFKMSRDMSESQSESEGSEVFIFLPIPLLFPSLTIRLRRFEFH